MMDVSSDKLSIKSLLFTKAIPNYLIPIPVNGHKVFSCTDCGDKFLFETSYNDHINRKSVKISYMCRHCNRLKYFHNRCNLLFHIRSHAFKTATINVTDLKVEPLPLSHFKTIPELSELSTPSGPSPQQATESTTTITTTIASTSIESTTIASTTPATKETTTTVSTTTTTPTTYATFKSPTTEVFCFECKANITYTGIAFRDRATHFLQFTNEVFSCPVCLFALPNVCALKVHFRLHLKCPPYYCPECGIHLINKNIQYPYNHDCEGFKMMRATARLNCTVSNCSLFHPNDYKEHMKKYHLKKVYKCQACVVACFNYSTMEKHLKTHKMKAKSLLLYQCNVCPGRYVLQNPKLNDQHLKSHINTTIYPCWACGSAFKTVSNLLNHFIRQHNKVDDIRIALNDILHENAVNVAKPKRIYRVVKRCDQCKRSFTYKCKYEEIQTLPNECPFQCTSTMESNVTPERIQDHNSGHIICHLCNLKMSQDWSEIKKHYAELHRTHKCLDIKIKLKRLDVNKYLSQNKIPITKADLSSKNIIRRTRNRNFELVSDTSTQTSVPMVYACNICGNNYAEKDILEKHIITHRDPCMAYQCMECGQSFVVKPTFSKHLILEHGINDVENYINDKQCYNEDALQKYQKSIETPKEPLKDNQCTICREEFDKPEDLEKHFRMHGMAFLMKNTLKNNATT